MKDTHTKNHMALWLRSLARLRNKLKPIILSMATKLGRMVTYLKKLLTIKHLVLWSFGLARSRANKNHISPTRLPMATKLGRIIRYLIVLLPIKSLYILISWSCEITWQNKSIISPRPQWLWPPNLVEWWITLRGSYHYSHLTF